MRRSNRITNDPRLHGRDCVRMSSSSLFCFDRTERQDQRTAGRGAAADDRRRPILRHHHPTSRPSRLAREKTAESSFASPAYISSSPRFGPPSSRGWALCSRQLICSSNQSKLRLKDIILIISRDQRRLDLLPRDPRAWPRNPSWSAPRHPSHSYPTARCASIFVKAPPAAAVVMEPIASDSTITAHPS